MFNERTPTTAVVVFECPLVLPVSVAKLEEHFLAAATIAATRDVVWQGPQSPDYDRRRDAILVKAIELYQQFGFLGSSIDAGEGLRPLEGAG